MQIIPVIDLKQGLVVRGVAGQRERYRPVESCFAADAAPATVARALVEEFDFDRVYVADLDAIGGQEPDWRALEAIAGAGLRLLVDAGTADAQRARPLVRFAERQGVVDALVVGLESVDDPRQLAGLPELLGGGRAVFSLDLQAGRPLTSSRSWQGQSPGEIAAAAVGAGFQRLIVLDLAAVGVDSGPRAIELCRTVRRNHPRVQLISGGGIRGPDDLRGFERAGCDAVLVASALHHGRLTRGEVAAWR